MGLSASEVVVPSSTLPPPGPSSEPRVCFLRYLPRAIRISFSLLDLISLQLLHSAAPEHFLNSIQVTVHPASYSLHPYTPFKRNHSNIPPNPTSICPRRPPKETGPTFRPTIHQFLLDIILNSQDDQPQRTTSTSFKPPSTTPSLTGPSKHNLLPNA